MALTRARQVAIVAALVATACSGPASHPAPAGAGGAHAKTSATCEPVAHWSTRRLAAQTVIVPVEQSDVRALRAEVAAGAGGVILFGASAPVNLGTRLSALRRAAPGRLGVLVMTDEEGGGVQRMANLVGNLPWASYMGTHWGRRHIRTAVAAVARKMARLGVNVDLAPVVDVDGRDVPPGPQDPDGWRSFSGRTDVVTKDGLAYARGLRDGGVLAVLKHFPGLGGASGNTDNGAASTLPWSKLRKVGLPPFVAGIRAGVPAVMVANARVPGLTRGPASLSAAVIAQELVRTLHFRGLILTDSLTAGAISRAGFGLARAAVQAIRAGADMVMYGAGSAAATRSRFNGIVAAEVSAVTHGSLSRSRLIAAARAALVARHVAACA